jgi:hypothetical protein
VVVFDHVYLFAPCVEAKGHELCLLCQILVGRHGEDFVPVCLLEHRIQVVNNNLLETMRAFDGEHAVISQNCVDVVHQTTSAKLMAAVLKTVRSVRLNGTNPTDVGIDHFLFWNCQGFNEMHQVVEGLLYVESTSFK